MKEKILLAFLILIGIISIFFIVLMASYISTFEIWYSFMKLETAIVTLVCFSLVLLAVVSGIIFLFINEKRD